MNKGRKRSLLLVVSLTLVVILLIGGTVAWLTDSRSITNILGIGRDADDNRLVKIELYEDGHVMDILDRTDMPTDTEIEAGTDSGTKKVLKGDNGEVHFIKNADDEYVVDTTKRTKLLPGGSIKKDPTVKVAGEQPVYLRMRVLVTDENDQVVDAFNLPMYKNPSDHATAPGLNLKPGADWFQVGDDNWYYFGTSATTPTTVAKADGEKDIFVLDGSGVSMKIPTSWTSAQIEAFKEANLTLKVEVQAVQSEHFTPNMGAADPWASAAADFVSIGG